MDMHEFYPEIDVFTRHLLTLKRIEVTRLRTALHAERRALWGDAGVITPDMPQAKPLDLLHKKLDAVRYEIMKRGIASSDRAHVGLRAACFPGSVTPEEIAEAKAQRGKPRFTPKAKFARLAKVMRIDAATRRKLRALDAMTERNGCTPHEASAAARKAAEIRKRMGVAK
jgi:hypothetical protein